MAEYEQDFALVYDPYSQDFVGCFDEYMFLHLLRSGDFKCLSSRCGDYIKANRISTLCTVPEDCSAKDALPLVLSQRSRRVFVWSTKRDGPMGCVTARCYLGYITKHLRGCHRHRKVNVDDIRSTVDYVTVSDDTTLRELTGFLLEQEELLLHDSDGITVYILNRKIILHYILSLLHKKEIVRLSTVLRFVLDYFRSLPNPRPLLPVVGNSSPLIEVLPIMLSSADGVVLGVDREKGRQRVLSVWDVLQHMLYHLVEESDHRAKSSVVRGGVTIPVLTIARDESERSLIQFEGSSAYTLGVDSLGNLAISAGDQPMLIMNNEHNISIHMRNLSVRSIDFGGDLVVEGVSQFKMIWREDFVDSGGWSGTVDKVDVSKCAGIPMLGGFKNFGRGSVQKTFIELPVHRELRLKATFHFLDQWSGESGYMKINPSSSAPLEYIWTDSHVQGISSGINICGGDTPDSKFAVPIDVTIPHSAERFTVGRCLSVVGKQYVQNSAVRWKAILFRSHGVFQGSKFTFAELTATKPCASKHV
ncbi:uncharacterized protein BXIN_1493 [Babesia sp. Xinjiang]|uniref:uncharacterized protein n=1 Tax=Babesia sp. Xinjiang TaxID=462227 RepID=UPI000A239FD4|nr:uncharacterized protein BXIN_1493 [Babesia sp. Xinjiang]ORM42256.1 hypothetical protein BXIN_1493 [Babesia sp. Xinjiang]